MQSTYIPMRCKTRIRKRPGWLSSEIRNDIKEKQKAFSIRFKKNRTEVRFISQSEETEAG